MSSFLEKKKTEFEEKLKNDTEGKKGRELTGGCYECGQEINANGVWNFLEATIKEAVEEAFRLQIAEIREREAELDRNWHQEIIKKMGLGEN